MATTPSNWIKFRHFGSSYFTTLFTLRDQALEFCVHSWSQPLISPCNRPLWGNLCFFITFNTCLPEEAVAKPAQNKGSNLNKFYFSKTKGSFTQSVCLVFATTNKFDMLATSFQALQCPVSTLGTGVQPRFFKLLFYNTFSISSWSSIVERRVNVDSTLLRSMDCEI